MMDSEDKGTLQLIVSSFLVGISSNLVRLARDLGNFGIVFYRVLFAAIFLYLITLFVKRIKITEIKTEKLKLFFFGILHAGVLICSYASINLLTISSAVLLASTISIWTIFFSWLILRERISAKTFLGITVAFIGVIMIVNSNGRLGFSFLGSILGICVGIFGGLIYILSKTFKDYNKTSLAFWQNVIALVFLTPLLLINHGRFTFINLGVVVVLGFLGAVTFIFLLSGLGKIKGQKAGVLTLLESVFASILAVIFFSEIPSILVIIGGGLIILGAYIVNR